MPNPSLRYSLTACVQWVPKDEVLDAAYHTRDRNLFLFSEQIGRWLEKGGYAQPVQIGDRIPLQLFARDISPVEYTIYNYDGSVYIATTTMSPITTSAVPVDVTVWQVVIDTTTWPPGIYYIVAQAGTGPDLIYLRTEPLDVRLPIDCEDTFLVEATNSENTQDIIFDGSTPYSIICRFPGAYDNKFIQKFFAEFFEDQTADLEVLGAIPYEDTELVVGSSITGNVPDWVAKKALRMLLMDDCKLDGINYTISNGASEMTVVFSEGAPKKIHKIRVRPSINVNGVTVLLNGNSATNNSVVASLDAESVGPNANNSSTNTTQNIINVIIN